MSLLSIASNHVSLKTLLPLLPLRVQSRIRDSHYLTKLRTATLSDEVDLQVIDLLVNPGDAVMDIGANFGLFTRFLSEKTGPEGSVHSFEPTVTMSRVLNHNVNSLALGNVTTSPLALSDKNGSAQIRVPVHGNRTPNYYEASLCISPDTAIGEVDTVQTTTLDAYCEANAVHNLTFIKCDVEGHEIAVLKGARRTLEIFRPAILLEINEPLHEPGHGTDARQMIESLHYDIHVFENGAIRRWRNDETFVNYVLLPR
jgi:FkbM family methyltransferase